MGTVSVFNVKDPPYSAQGNGITNDTAAIQSAITDAFVVGGVVYFPPGVYNFNSTLSLESNERPIMLMGVGAPPIGAHNLGTVLKWTGGASTAIRIGNLCRTAILQGFQLDNTGSGAVGIQVGNNTSETLLRDIVIFPQVGFTIGLDIGGSGNAITTYLTDVYLRDNGTNLRLTQVNAHTVAVRLRCLFASQLDLEIGTASFGPTSARFYGCTFESKLGKTPVVIRRCIGVSFYGCYWEHDGAGTYAVDIASDAVKAFSVLVDGAYLNGNAFGASTDKANFAFNVAFASAYLTVTNTYLAGYANGAAIVRNQNSTRITLENIEADYTGATIASSLTTGKVFHRGIALAGPVQTAFSGTGETFAGDVDAAGGYRQSIDGWYRENIAASQTNLLLSRLATSTVSPSAWIAPRAGSITALWVKMNVNRTGGTLTTNVFRHGVLVSGLSAVLDATNLHFKSTTVAKDTLVFAAGDLLDIRATTNGAWAPTTGDIRAGLEVET